MKSIWEKYAALLLRYSLDLQSGDTLYVSSTTLAVPLLKEVQRLALEMGAHPEFDIAFEGQGRRFYDFATDAELQRAPVLYSRAMESFDAYLNIRAPFNLSAMQGVSPDRLKKRAEALQPWMELYSKRTASGAMNRTLCQFPTPAAAQMAGMSLEDYQAFVFDACRLDEPDPVAAWLEVRAQQQHITDYLNACTRMRYTHQDWDIRFSTEGRTWINSDGMANMPSGEVFTAPVEDSVEGTVFFSYPSIYRGKEVSGVRLEVQQGYVVQWSADKGQEVLDEVFAVEGARRFGEAAIGTNYKINRITRNILFDEKIGGSIHMAVGQSYYHCGGKNKSSIHWDLISDMRNGGKIYADDRLIYENGAFLI